MTATLSNATFTLHVVSAHEEIFSGTVRMVSVNTVLGEVGILPRHSPLLTLLRPGELRMQFESGEDEYIYISGGMLEVQPHLVTVLADTALRGEQIDEQAALQAKRHAEETIRTSILYSDRDEAQAELIKALAQLQTLADARKKKRR
jgi:F-type H+-transporting ATPase subunit epsilon